MRWGGCESARPFLLGVDMDIQFYTCADPPNKLDKTLTPTVKLTGDFNANVDVVEPSIRCHGTYDMESNYVHIPAFNRYYFVEGVELVNNKQFIVSLQVDPLQSYKEHLTPDNVKCYDGYKRIDSSADPFNTESLVFVCIEGVR